MSALKKHSKPSHKIILCTGATPGLMKDAYVVRDALREISTSRIEIPRSRNLHLLHKALVLQFQKELGLFKGVIFHFENIYKDWLKPAKKNILVINQEWVRPPTEDLISRMDFIFCKTKYAYNIVQNKGLPAVYIGFTSPERIDKDVPKDWNMCLHVVGRSPSKGTEAVIRTWSKHPEWAPLHVVMQKDLFEKVEASNIIYYEGFLTDLELSNLMAKAGIHICTSETEGFGHSICEAMSCGALVVTTNAPPMNELLSASECIYVNYDKLSEAGWGQRFHISENDLEEKINFTFSLTEQERKLYGDASRKRYVENELRFTTQIQNACLSIFRE